MPAKPPRTYGAAHFALELDDKQQVGLCKSIEGGGVKAEMIEYRTGPEHRHWKQVSKPKYEDVKIQVGMSMSEPFYDWISKFFNGTIIRKNGAIAAGDFFYKERARREMFQMLISEVAMPALDGGDKNDCFMTVTIAPERVVFKPGSNKEFEKQVPGKKQKRWTANNFALTLDGPFKDKTTRVNKVDGFSIKQQIIDHQVGSQRDPIRIAGLLEIPNITFHIPEVDSEPFVKHMEEHIQSGKPGARFGGEIEFRDQLAKTWCSVTLGSCEIANVEPTKSDSTSSDQKTVKVEITVEEMSFKYS